MIKPRGSEIMADAAIQSRPVRPRTTCGTAYVDVALFRSAGAISLSAGGGGPGMRHDIYVGLPE